MSLNKTNMHSDTIVSEIIDFNTIVCSELEANLKLPHLTPGLVSNSGKVFSKKNAPGGNFGPAT